VTPRLSLLVPFRDADGSRTPAMEWVVARWRHYWPEAELIMGTDDGVDPFNKSMAVNDAASRATGRTLAILDADTWMDPAIFEGALVKVEAGIAPWCRPASYALRLRRDVSERLLRLKPTEPLPRIVTAYAETSSPVVGFLWIVPRAGFERMGGMDERIRGWGGEDSAFTIAADKVLGRHRAFRGTLICLWHPRPRDERQMRVWEGQDRRLDEEFKAELIKQYRRASGSAGMLAVLAAAGGPLRAGWASS